MPDKRSLKHNWKRALRYENIDHLKVFNVCIEHFGDGDVELLHKCPNGDGTFTEIPCGKLELKDDTIPSLLSRCPSYFPRTSEIKGLVCPMSHD